jgi:hypothetical protein
VTYVEIRVLTNPGANNKDIFIKFILFIRWGY